VDADEAIVPPTRQHFRDRVAVDGAPDDFDARRPGIREMQEYRLGFDAQPQVIKPTDDTLLVFGCCVDPSHSVGID
jgi:hypothetical protein